MQKFVISGKNGDKLGMVAYDRFPALLSSLSSEIFPNQKSVLSTFSCFSSPP